MIIIVNNEKKFNDYQSKSKVTVQVLRHTGESRYPDKRSWIPAYAGMTNKRVERLRTFREDKC